MIIDFVCVSVCVEERESEGKMERKRKKERDRETQTQRQRDSCSNRDSQLLRMADRQSFLRTTDQQSPVLLLSSPHGRKHSVK